jgi:hypothetical protein
MLVGKEGDYHKRLGWKGLPKKNTLADYEHLQISDVKGFMTFGPELKY